MHVAGIGPSLAEKIVYYREKKGPFRSREALNAVPGFGPKTFEQSIGFLRIRDGDNPLDATAIHPESYVVAEQVLDLLDVSVDTESSKRIEYIANLKKRIHIGEFAEILQIGQQTLEDILDEIAQPGRDPRKNLPEPILRQDVVKLEDLSPGMELRGTIRNVVDFGAFVDIGVKTDGLLHRSKIKTGTRLKVGEIIEVSILAIDQERNRISLDMMERPQDDSPYW
ncbi:MAG: helix-hairpin-helix domain-containing protein, partial [Anaerolineales bacterium]